MADAPVTDEMLFGYAAGDLDDNARARVEAALAADPSLRERLRWYEAVCDGFVAALPPSPALPGADQILARIRGGRPGPVNRFFSWLAGPALRPAAALAAVLILAQGALIGVLLQPAEAPLTRSPASTGNAVVFVVAFNPETPEAKIRSLLLEAGASLIDGPQQLGEYRVWVPANRAQFARELFGASVVIEYVRQEQPGAMKKW
jgi:anti-sigma factor RsiW